MKACCRPAPRIAEATGAVLLEVVLALVLFVAAAAIVTQALNNSVNSVERMRLRAEAADLSVTLLSEIELGLRPRLPAPAVPAPPPHTNWTWEIVPDTEPAVGQTVPARVEVVVRHLDPPFVHRLAAWLPPGTAAAGAALPGVDPLSDPDPMTGIAP